MEDDIRKQSNPVLTRVGASIKELREAAGLTQAELGKMSGVTQGQIARYESGAAYPGLEIAMAMSDALGVPIDVLVGRSSPIEVPKIISHFGLGSSELEGEEGQIKVPLVPKEVAVSGRGRVLSASHMLGWVSIPTRHLADRYKNRLACVYAQSPVPPIILENAILCLDYSDLPRKDTKGSERGLFLTDASKRISISKVIRSDDSLVIADNSVRHVDLRRHKNPLIARVVWIGQPISTLAGGSNFVTI